MAWYILFTLFCSVLVATAATMAYHPWIVVGTVDEHDGIAVATLAPWNGLNLFALSAVLYTGTSIISFLWETIRAVGRRLKERRRPRPTV